MRIDFVADLAYREMKPVACLAYRYKACPVPLYLEFVYE